MRQLGTCRCRGDSQILIAQFAAQDLADGGLGQGGAELDAAGTLVAGEVFLAVVADFLLGNLAAWLAHAQPAVAAFDSGRHPIAQAAAAKDFDPVDQLGMVNVAIQVETLMNHPLVSTLHDTGQLKVIGAIRACRTAALGGHVMRCSDCDHPTIAYNSCRNRHCPKCQSRAAKRWLDARAADLLPVEYYHVVFTLPAPIADIAYQNKAALYGLLFDIAAQTLLRIAADPKHLGAHIGATLVLHTWGSALTHHPHVHGIVPGGGLAPDGKSWVACRSGFFLPVRVLSRLMRRRFIEELWRLHQVGRLRFFGELAALADGAFFNQWLAPMRQCEWVVYAKRPFAGPQAVLTYLSRYTHRVAISNSRLVAMDERGVSFKWKDYRAKGSTRHKTMTLAPQEFMRRFLLHVLPGGFHRIRHYGLLANGNRRECLALARQLLGDAPTQAVTPSSDEQAEVPSSAAPPVFVCRHCGLAMTIVQSWMRGQAIRAPPPS